MNFGEKPTIPSAETPEDNEDKKAQEETEEQKPTLGKRILKSTLKALEAMTGGGIEAAHARRLNEEAKEKAEEADKNKLEELRQDIEKKIEEQKK